MNSENMRLLYCDGKEKLTVGAVKNETLRQKR
jgi:hypothetical protein